MILLIIWMLLVSCSTVSGLGSVQTLHEGETTTFSCPDVETPIISISLKIPDHPTKAGDLNEDTPSKDVFHSYLKENEFLNQTEGNFANRISFWRSDEGRYEFTIANCSIEDSGAYQCSVVDDRGDVQGSRWQTLQVVEAIINPILTKTPNVSYEHKSTTVSCMTQQNTGKNIPNITLYQLKGGKRVNVYVQTSFVSMNNKRQMRSDWKSILTRDENGVIIVCEVSNSITKVKKEVYVVIEVKYAVNQVAVRLTSSGVAECIADGNPQPNFSWTITGNGCSQTGKRYHNRTIDLTKGNWSRLNTDCVFHCTASNFFQGKNETNKAHSDILKVHLPITEPMQQSRKNEPNKYSLTILLVAVLGTFAGLIVLVGIILRLKKRNRPKSHYAHGNIDAVSGRLDAHRGNGRISHSSYLGYVSQPSNGLPAHRPLVVRETSNDDYRDDSENDSVFAVASSSPVEARTISPSDFWLQVITKQKSEPVENSSTSTSTAASTSEYLHVGCEHTKALVGLKNKELIEKFRLDSKDVNLVTRIGEGYFGEVWQAELKLPKVHNYSIETVCVAVKVLKTDAGCKDKKDLINEITVFSSLDPHPHIIKFVGCCIEPGHLMLILELMVNGNLHDYLCEKQKLEHARVEDVELYTLIRFACEIAHGMEYLSSKQLLHRDLATRNILLDEKYTSKIGDFGFSRDIIDSSHYYSTSKILPVRWMSPESIERKVFTTESDVWSYGIVLYEIFSLGARPYAECSSGQDVMNRIKQGYKPERPEGCPQTVYNLMLHCCQYHPRKRPTFVSLRESLDVIKQEAKKHDFTLRAMRDLENNYLDMSGSNSSIDDLEQLKGYLV